MSVYTDCTMQRVGEWVTGRWGGQRMAYKDLMQE